jgi:hypothetical protein
MEREDENPMAFHSLHIPRRTALASGVPVSRNRWLEAARRTDAELWELSQTNRPSSPVEPSPIADARRPR